jgi:hypothetical protein
MMVWRCPFCLVKWAAWEDYEAHMRDCRGEGFLCPNCQRTSYHPKDVEHRFCVMCGFADDPVAAA